MNKNKKRNIVIVFALLMLVTISGSLVSSTYAKYTAKLNDATGTAEVAKWAFKTDNTLDNLSFNLADTVDASTLTNGKIAPGTSGEFDVKLVNTNSDVAVSFEISVKEIANAPTNLKLYADASHTTEFNADSPITGTLAAKDAEGVSSKIYWVWDYEQTNVTEGDTADTTDGEAAKTITVTIGVTGTQMQPTNTAVTSKIN